MYKIGLEIIEFDKWNRKILNSYWYLAAVALFTEIIIFFVGPYRRVWGDTRYLMLFIVRPAVIDVALLAITECIYKLIKVKHMKMAKYIVTGCGTLFVCNMVYVHYSVNVIYALFVFPIFLSVFYEDKKLTYFTALLNLACYLSIVLLYLPTRPAGSYNHNIMDFTTSIAILACVLILVLSFLDRAKEIMESLVNMHQSQQELAIRNFVMEFNSKMEPATGLYNHKTFYEYLQNLIEQSEKYGFKLSLAVLDLDNFKRINDTYGHSLGDEVIKALSEIIKKNIRADDYAARYGGEEFAIIFTDKGKEEAFEIAEKIRIQLNDIIIDDMNNERFGVSIGVSEHTKGMSKQIFFSNTDAAQYKAKRIGKNRTIIYSEDMEEDTPKV